MTKRLTLFLIICAAASVASAGDPPPSPQPSASSDILQNRQLPRSVAEAAEAPKDETPPMLHWMLKPLERGMFVRLPIIDSDPNRGITYGVMPIIVLQGKDSDRIEQIHAPSLTYNRYFKFSPTYRYYYYPQDDASLMARVSDAKYEHEGMLEYEDRSVFGSPYDVYFRVQQNADAGQRFFGLGPDSSRDAEANYKQEYWLFRWELGAPVVKDMPWRAHLAQRYQSSRVLNGPIPGLPSFREIFPSQFSERYQESNETRLHLDYDTRDHAVTPTRGRYADFYLGRSVKDYLSQYDYSRYGTDLRVYEPDDAHGRVFAAQFLYEQVLGATPPFWLLPQLGGKYSLRAYGDGRYVARGMSAINAEERFRVYEARTAGVTTEIQLAPFVGVGEAFDAPGRVALRYAHPVVGGAVRAVAKPQVVGSVDFGVGREGLSVFTDINYSF